MLYIKLLSLIEKVGRKPIGFSYWKLFIINYFRSYEVSFSLNNNFKNNFYYKIYNFILRIFI